MSIRWFRTQHPSPVMGGGEFGLAPAMLQAFLWNLLAFTCSASLCVRCHTENENQVNRHAGWRCGRYAIGEPSP